MTSSVQPLRGNGLEPTRLVAIASAGHSGSTLLDLLLGNHPRVSSAGEMNRLTLFPGDRVCACRAVVNECEYWNRVREVLTRAAGRGERISWRDCATDVPPMDPLTAFDLPGVELRSGEPVPDALRGRLASHGFVVSAAATIVRDGTRDFKWRLVDQGAAGAYVLRRDGTTVEVYPEELQWRDPLRRLPDPLEISLVLGKRTLVSGIARLSNAAAARVHAAENSWSIADAMAAVDGSSYVIDSSKSPVRLKLLQVLRPEHVRVLHLVRDGRAVCASAMRRTRLPADRAARTWHRDNRNVEMMLRTVPSRFVYRVSYEALCDNPEATMAAVCAFLELDFSPRLLELWSRPVHNIPGNPMLFDRERRAIARDDRWRRSLSPDDLATFERVAGRMNREFGYA